MLCQCMPGGGFTSTRAKFAQKSLESAQAVKRGYNISVVLQGVLSCWVSRCHQEVPLPLGIVLDLQQCLGAFPAGN